VTLPLHVAVTAGAVTTIDLTADIPTHGETVTVAIVTAHPATLWWTTNGTTPAAWTDGVHTNHWPEPAAWQGNDGAWRGGEPLAHATRPRNPVTGQFTGPAVLKVLCPDAAQTITIDRPGAWSR